VEKRRLGAKIVRNQREVRWREGGTRQRLRGGLAAVWPQGRGKIRSLGKWPISIVISWKLQVYSEKTSIWFEMRGEREITRKRTIHDRDAPSDVRVDFDFGLLLARRGG